MSVKRRWAEKAVGVSRIALIHLVALIVLKRNESMPGKFPLTIICIAPLIICSIRYN